MDEVARLYARIAELEDQVRARDDFVATASHELRNPMGAFVLQVQHLILLSQDDAALAPLAPKLHALERQLHAYTRRATTLLGLSRILSGSFAPHHERLDFSAIVLDAVALFRLQCERAGSVMTVSVPAGIRGEWDASVLELVTHNLISNAIKYGSGRPIAVSLADNAPWIELSIKDHGIGISQADQQRIFGCFERAFTRRMSGGFGLGLWITQQLVHSLRGRMTVHSEPGLGSTFTIALPAEKKA